MASAGALQGPNLPPRCRRSEGNACFGLVHSNLPILQDPRRSSPPESPCHVSQIEQARLQAAKSALVVPSCPIEHAEYDRLRMLDFDLLFPQGGLLFPQGGLLFPQADSLLPQVDYLFPATPLLLGDASGMVIYASGIVRKASSRSLAWLSTRKSTESSSL